MTFKLADPDATYRTEVVVDVPTPEGGTEGLSCTIHFRLLPAPVMRRLVFEGDEALLLAMVAGWDGIALADGQPLEFSEANVKLLAEHPYFARSVGDAYTRFAQGLPGKTSAQPPSTGAGRTRAATTR